jgi:hypothetical protein
METAHWTAPDAIVALVVRCMSDQTVDNTSCASKTVEQSNESIGEVNAKLKRYGDLDAVEAARAGEAGLSFAVVAGGSSQPTQLKTLVKGAPESGRDQARGIQQIASGFQQMEQVTQAAAASAEENAAAAQQLGAESGCMSEMVRHLTELIG